MQTATFRYTEADIADAWRVQARHNVFMKLINIAPWVIIVFNLLIGIWLWRGKGWDASIPSFTWVLLGAALILWRVLGDRFLLPNRARRFLSQQKSMQEVGTIVWDEHQITFSALNGETRHCWSDFSQWADSRSSLVLFQSDNVMNIVPKRCLSDDQVTEVRRRLEAALGPAGRKRK